MYLHVPATLSLSAGLQQAALWVFPRPWGRHFNLQPSASCRAGLSRQLVRHSFSDGGSSGDGGSQAKAGHPCLPSPFAPFPLQNVKEQARERRTGSTLPRFDGNAAKKFIYSTARPG
jgi:hypothetical protein